MLITDVENLFKETNINIEWSQTKEKKKKKRLDWNNGRLDSE